MQNKDRYFRLARTGDLASIARRRSRCVRETPESYSEIGSRPSSYHRDHSIILDWLIDWLIVWCWPEHVVLRVSTVVGRQPRHVGRPRTGPDGHVVRRVRRPHWPNHTTHTLACTNTCVLIAKFHYTDTDTDPTRTRPDPHGPARTFFAAKLRWVRAGLVGSV